MLLQTKSFDKVIGVSKFIQTTTKDGKELFIISCIRCVNSRELHLPSKPSRLNRASSIIGQIKLLKGKKILEGWS